MTGNKKYSLIWDAARLIRSLADVVEAIADTYSDTVLAAEAQPMAIEAAEPKALPAEKKASMEDVRSILAQKSQKGMTAEVRELIKKYGGTKLSDVDPTQYAALLAEAEVLGNE